MWRTRPILGFLCRFVIVFGLLVAPWPGWRETYGGYLRKSAMVLYGSFGSKGMVTFAPNPSGDKADDTIVHVVKRKQSAASDHGAPGFRISLDVNSREIGYCPTALVSALVLATGIGWRRRLCALVWGLVWIHAFIAFLLGLAIAWVICGSSSLGLFEVSPFWQEVVSFLYASFFILSGMRLAAAVLIWVVVTFRRDDWVKLLGKEPASTGKQVRQSHTDGERVAEAFSGE